MADAATATHAAQIGSALLQAGLVEGKPLAPERLHVTLHHLGDYAGGLPPSLVARASQAAERVAQQAFEVEFDRVGTFGGRRSQLPCVLRGEEQVRGLYDLQGALGRQLAHVGIAGDAQYTPHMTLLYCNQSLPQRRCDRCAGPSPTSPWCAAFLASRVTRSKGAGHCADVHAGINALACAHGLHTASVIA